MVPDEENNITLGEIADCAEIEFWVLSTSPENRNLSDSLVIERRGGQTAQFLIKASNHSVKYGSLVHGLLAIAYKNFSYVQYNGTQSIDDTAEVAWDVFLYSKEPLDPVSAEGLKAVCRKMMTTSRLDYYPSVRVIIPCAKKYAVLELRKDVEVPLTPRLISNVPNRMISPFVLLNEAGQHSIQIKDIDALVRWVHEKSRYPDVEIEDVRAAYNQFINDVDELMADDEKWNQMKRYRLLSTCAQEPGT